MKKNGLELLTSLQKNQNGVSGRSDEIFDKIRYNSCSLFASRWAELIVIVLYI